MALSRVVGMTLFVSAMALPSLERVASAQAAPAAASTTPRSVDWSTINDSEPVVRVDAYGGTAQAIGGKPVPVFGVRAAATFSKILHAGATATFFAPTGNNTGVLWSPALEIGLDPPTGNFEIRPILGAGILLGSFEVLPTIYPAVTIGYRDYRRKFFIGGEARVNLLADFHLVFIPATITTMGVLGGYL
jgi:hypothetical protein